ncbi:hypothetical protein HGM15179_016858 [Zosterops borbonicus]|uniref:Uncharacterized protein n=1 Tax=Zosterops borbonicus TaxID=364589 RepID=A0A8K1G1V2_9PASS|nr:hypothetical protein HGM15179_016858 [Zosterops borbonicus]
MSNLASGTARDPGAATANLGIPAQTGTPNSQYPIHPCPLAFQMKSILSSPSPSTVRVSQELQAPLGSPSPCRGCTDLEPTIRKPPKTREKKEEKGRRRKKKGEEGRRKKKEEEGRRKTKEEEGRRREKKEEEGRRGKKEEEGRRKKKKAKKEQLTSTLKSPSRLTHITTHQNPKN